MKKVLLLLIFIDLILITIGIGFKYKFNASKENSKTYRYAMQENDAYYKFIQDNYEIITFYANTFQIESVDLITKLKESDDFEISNENLDKRLLNFLLKLEKENKSLFDSTINPCIDDKKYIVALIKYWCNIYTNVDFATAASIGQIESGYRAKHLLRKNNIFGGIGKNGILSYKNIEYGTLRFVKLLSESYYGKGLDTVEKIGVKYNPTYDDNGNKIAVPEWVHDVTITRKVYEHYDTIVDVNYLISNKKNSDFIANSNIF